MNTFEKPAVRRPLGYDELETVRKVAAGELVEDGREAKAVMNPKNIKKMFESA